jgi:hypothetical protein
MTTGVIASAVLCRRALREIPRVPGRIAFPMLIPILQMILFAAVFQNFGQYKTASSSSSIEFLAAGQVALSVLVGAGGAGFQMVQDIDSGFFGAMWSGISLNVALRTKNAEITGASNVLIFPLYFASTAFVPYALLPSWLQTLNKVNPVSYLVDGMRALMLGGWGWGTIGEAFLAAAAVGAVTLPLAVQAFRRSVQT